MIQCTRVTFAPTFLHWYRCQIFLRSGWAEHTGSIWPCKKGHDMWESLNWSGRSKVWIPAATQAWQWCPNVPHLGHLQYVKSVHLPTNEIVESQSSRPLLHGLEWHCPIPVVLCLGLQPSHPRKHALRAKWEEKDIQLTEYWQAAGNL